MVTRRSALRPVAMAAVLIAATPPGRSPPDWSAALVELADISGVSASPDGRFILFRVDRGDLATNSYRLRWLRLDVRSGQIVDVGSGGRPIYDDPGVLRHETPLWSPDGHTAYLRLLDGSGAIGIWRLAARSRALEPAAIHDGNVGPLTRTPDGGALSYSVGPPRTAIAAAEQAEYESGVRIDESVDLGQALVRGGTVDGRPATQRLVGYWFVRDGLLRAAPRQSYRLDFATGERSWQGPSQPASAFVPPTSMLVASASGHGLHAEASWQHGRGAVKAQVAGRTIRCRHPMCGSHQVNWLQWRPGQRELLVAFQDRQLDQSLALWAPETNRFRHLVAAKGLLSGSRSRSDPCAITADGAFCVASSAASPPRLVRIALDKGTLGAVHDPNGSWRAAYRPRVKRLDLVLPSGANVTGVLLTGSASLRRAPLFLNYYRCEGFLRGGEGHEWPLPVLLNAGFAVACLNAAPRQGAQDAIRTYEDGLAAVRALIDGLARAGVVDRRRVSMGGFSFGSEVALWVASHSDLLAAVSIASAQWEPSNYWTTALLGAKARAMSRAVWGLGAPDETPDAWARLSPARNAARIRAPVLLQLPEQEARRVPELVVRLRDAGTPVDFYGFPDENHLKVQPRHRLAAYRRNADWLRYWLQDYRDPAPAKAQQYRWWDAMRRARPSATDPAAQP